MAQHKDYDITPRVAYLADGGGAHAATYAVSRGGVGDCLSVDWCTTQDYPKSPL